MGFFVYHFVYRFVYRYGDRLLGKPYPYYTHCPLSVKGDKIPSGGSKNMAKKSSKPSTQEKIEAAGGTCHTLEP